MTILAFILWFVTALFALGIVTHNKDIQPKNKVHFYVARNKRNNGIWLYMGKPTRDEDYEVWITKYSTITGDYDFKKVGLNIDDYKDLKWEDQPVEVFLNLED